MVFDFLQPVSEQVIQKVKSLTGQHLGSKVVFHSATDFPDLDKVKIAIVGVLENRGNESYSAIDNTAFRDEFYNLYPGNWNVSIADLGDIEPGNSVDDTSFALKGVVIALLKKQIIPVVIGGSQELTYALYRAYDTLEQMVNLVTIDSKFDFGKENEPLSAGSYLTKIIADEPNNLFNFSNLGYQTYYNSQEEIDLIEKLFFDAYRLGELSSSISLAEPVVREADLVSLDLNSVQSSATGNFATFTPNGFNGKEICALARYAGISDKVSLFGIFNQAGTAGEAVLIAQLVWYFIEGYHYRSSEYPYADKSQYLKFIVPFEDQEFIFFKSNKSDRWWIDVPIGAMGNNKDQRSALLPCSYEEYLAACNHQIPERWWKAQRKLSL